jgi:protease I
MRLIVLKSRTEANSHGRAHGAEDRATHPTGFAQVELTRPKKALGEAGAQTVIVSPAKGEAQGDALLLAGGVANPDPLRSQGSATCARYFHRQAQRGALPWSVNPRQCRRRAGAPEHLLARVAGRRRPGVDEEVACGRGLVSCCRRSDIPAVDRKMIEELSSVRHRA